MTQAQNPQKFKINLTLLVLAIVLTIFGGVMAVSTYSSYRGALLDNQDRQLTRMVNASDRNIATIMEDSRASLANIADSKRVKFAEEEWEETGVTDNLDQLLSNSVFVSSDLCATILIQKKGRIIYSLDEDRDYEFKSEKVSDNIRICKNLNGNLFLAMDYENRDGLTYTAVLDLRRLYIQVAGGENGDDFYAIFIDRTRQIAVYPEGDYIIARSLRNTGSARLTKCIAFLSKCQREGSKGASSYNISINNRENTIRVDAAPSGDSRNGVFAIAAAVNYENLQTITRGTNIRLFIFYMIMAVGIGLLIISILVSRRKNVEALQELEVLTEKNRVMEELQEKAENLAHMQRLETIGTMTSSIAHEFNNLLTPIMGYSMMTLEKLPPEEVELYDNVLEIYNASNKAKDIISRLSKLSRKNTDRTMVPLNPDLLINKTMNVTAPALPKNVDVVRRFGCSGVLISGNEVQLSQLIMNLIVNAFQAMTEEGGILTLTTERIEGADGQAGKVLIRIADTGPGMSEETMSKIFDPFFTTKVSGEGTGLGLAIAMQAVEDHKGRIEVESELGKGTAFSIYLDELPQQESDEDL